jgi:plasmid stability protein
MANLTLAIDDEVLKQARIRALERGTSVNALLREYLESFVGRDTAHRAMREVLELAQGSRSGSDGHGRTWTRDDAHER